MPDTAASDARGATPPPAGDAYPDTRPEDEQVIVATIAARLPEEVAARQTAYDAAFKAFARTGEPGREETARLRRNQLEQAERMLAGAAPYFARIRGRFRDASGGRFAEDVRVSGFPRMEIWETPAGEVVVVSQWAGIAEVARDPTTPGYEVQDAWERRGGRSGRITPEAVKVEDIEYRDGRITRVSPRFGEVWRERVRGRLLDPGGTGIGEMWGVLDPGQMRAISRRGSARRLFVVQGPAGTGKTVVALYYVGLHADESDPCLYVVPTPALARHVELGLRFSTRSPERWQVASLWELVQDQLPEIGDFRLDDAPSPLAAVKGDTDPDGLLGHVLRAHDEAGRRGGAALLRAYGAGVASYCRDRGLPARADAQVRREDLPALLLLAGRSVPRRRRPAEPDPAWVVVDEAQSLPPLGYLALRSLVGRQARFVLAGDPNQLLRADGGLRQLQAAAEPLAVRADAAGGVDLRSVYRTARRIFGLARRVLGGSGGDEEVTGLHEEEGEVDAQLAADAPAQAAAIARCLLEGRSRGLAMAVVIAPTPARARALGQEVAAALADLGQAALAQGAQLLDGADAYRGGLAFAPLEAMQGLEADLAIVADCDAAAYPDDEASARRLHTAITRARNRVVVAAAGAWSPPLARALAAAETPPAPDRRTRRGRREGTGGRGKRAKASSTPGGRRAEPRNNEHAGPGAEEADARGGGDTQPAPAQAQAAAGEDTQPASAQARAVAGEDTQPAPAQAQAAAGEDTQPAPAQADAVAGEGAQPAPAQARAAAGEDTQPAPAQAHTGAGEDAAGVAGRRAGARGPARGADVRGGDPRGQPR